MRCFNCLPQVFVRHLIRTLIASCVCLVLVACSGKNLKTVESPDAEQLAFKAEYESAVTLLKEGDYKSAIEKFETVTSQKPEYPGPYINLGVAWFRLGELDKARTQFLEVLSKREQSSLSDSSEEDGTEKSQGNSLEGKEQRSLSLEPFLLTAYNYLGLIDREQGKFKEAEARYRSALEIDAQHLASIRNLGILLDLYLGDLEGALDLYEQYQSLMETQDPQVKDWIFDIKARLKNRR